MNDQKESKVENILENRYGGKGVVSNILPTNKCNAKADILLNYSTICNRIPIEEDEDEKAESRFHH